MDFFQFIKDWINTNPGKAAGALIGFVFGILILTMGIGKTLLIILFVIIGLVIGKMKDENISFLDEIKGLFKRKNRDE